MKLYNITFSPTGGTDKVCEYLSSSWKGDKENIKLIKPDFPIPEICSDDICIIGMPVFSGRLPKTSGERLAKIKGNGASCILVAVYGNRAIDDVLVETSDIAEKCGFRVVAGIEAIAEHSIARNVAKGRPDSGDKEVLTGFFAKIREKLSSGDYSKPNLPGNRPYKEVKGGMMPYGDENCIFCGTCVRECPVGAIPTDTPNLTDSDICISCMRCIKVCPVGARRNPEGPLSAVTQKLTAMCSEPKENKLYI